MNRRLLSLLLVVLLLAVACGDDGSAAGSADADAAAAATDTTVASGLRGMRSDQVVDVSQVTLPDAAHGDAETPFIGPAGGLMLVFFGYTSCPDVCPTTMADLRTTLADLGADAERIDVAMVTIDPARDTSEVLTGYVTAFVDDARALRTDDDERLRYVAQAFGADYRIVDDGTGEPEVEHTGFVYAVDDQGRITLMWPHGTKPADYLHDVQLLLGSSPAAEADEAAQELEFTIPAGTADQIAAGEAVEVLPELLEVQLGDHIRIVNEDDRDHVIGPFYVAANAVMDHTFVATGEFAGSCSAHSSGQITVVVT